MTLREAKFDYSYRIASVKPDNHKQMLELLSFDIRQGALLRKANKTPFGDFIECVIDNRIICIPKDLMHTVTVEALA